MKEDKEGVQEKRAMASIVPDIERAQSFVTTRTSSLEEGEEWEKAMLILLFLGRGETIQNSNLFLWCVPFSLILIALLDACGHNNVPTASLCLWLSTVCFAGV